MADSRRVAYHILLALAGGGLIWLLANIWQPQAAHQVGICLFRRWSGIPCPSCGSTRSAVMLLRGNVAGAINTNPLGFITLAGLFTLTALFMYDKLGKNDAGYRLYLRAEQKLKQPRYAVILVLLLAANWAWSIYKHL